MKKVLFILTIGLLTGMMQSCKQNNTKLQTQVVQMIQRAVPDVTATVNNRIATLSGTVDSEDTKMMVEKLAKDVKGIHSVVNNIMVRHSEAPVSINPDNTIRSSIENQFREEGFNDINIQVDNGEIILSGDANRSDLTRIMQIANESSPRKVTNNLNLK